MPSRSLTDRPRIAFAGTPEFAARALDALIGFDCDIPLVLTQPDRPAGRGMKLTPSPVKARALAHGLTVDQPDTLKTPELRAPLAEAAPDLLVVVAYGLLLPRAVLDIPRLGCINIHASLLPRWRGAAPIQRAIEAGDARTGITLMQMDIGLDTGPMLAEHVVDITDIDTTATLHDRLAEAGARLLIDTLPDLLAGRVTPRAQPDHGACYAAKIGKTEAALDFRRPASELGRRLRAFDPFPGGLMSVDGTPIKLWRAEVLAEPGAPGLISRVDDHGVVIGCGAGSLCITELQKAGGRRLPVAEFLRGHALAAGQQAQLPG
ncbi:methionyl-tRNA formyltransferase [Methyloversatilis sp. XJ19-13]|uniref:methionyl-tRNA formyltransferase n=1 Tax=Methyloversatilis sp. XJ19-13 TaxID=2963430 RepID=UPI00211CC0AC|nr:methionyl-tRNA formyltransferase [Methyloversatilis sp. XJ19-13]MCQ9375469.1 methionyl-tRNA formyltransferase [Methyloversatilis sp. XJ19-13]